MLNSSIFSTVSLDGTGHVIYRTDFPVADLLQTKLEALWALHPEEFHTLLMHGKEVKTPRWQWTHEIPKMKKYLGRRISVTLRAFAD
ncbi:MAG: hypothetical protein AB8H12_12980 [Lewinella sp.]